MLLFFILFIPHLSFSSTSTTFDRANNLYQEKEYAAAITLYDTLIEQGYASAALYFNLANAHYKLGRLAPAILNYERAHKLAPDDEDIEFNLRLANLRVVDRVETLPELTFVKKIHNFIYGKSSDRWAWLAAGLLWGALLLGALFLFTQNPALKRFSFFAALLALILSIICAALSYNQYRYLQNSRYAILFSKNVYIKSAPDAQSTDLFILREGVKLQLLETVGEWQKIRLADGNVGWMPVKGLEVI